MLERIRKLVAGTPAQQPITKIKGGGSESNPYKRLGWEDKTDRRQKISRWMDRYRRGGPYADAIDAYPLFCLTNGYELNCEEGYEPLKDRVQAWMDEPQVDLDKIMWQGILSAILAGDAYQEVVAIRGGGVYNVLTRDPGTFTKVYDEFGNVTEYRQYVKSGAEAYSDKGISITPDVIINLQLFQIPGDVYGLSLWERADDDIQRDCDVIESVTKAVHRHGTPKQQWNIGTPESPASEADFDAVEDEIEKINAKTDFVTTNTQINMLDTGGVANVDTYSNVSLQRTACALGVPEEMLGLGRGSTEATATVRMSAFLDKISTIQKIVERTYNRALIDKITGTPGKVWIEFADVSPEDEEKKARWMALLRSGLDPDAIVPAAWAREQLGIPPDELADDESIEPPAEVPPNQQE
jgi:hypothetical protein